MDIDPYRLAYNVFHFNWKKFGIPSEDIPPPKTERVGSLDIVIPGFSNTVALFQIASRKDLKTFWDECPTAHNLDDVYTRFRNTMREALPKDSIVVAPPNDYLDGGASEDTTSEDVSLETMEEFLSENSLESDVAKDNKQEIKPNDATKEDLPIDTMKEGPLEDNVKDLTEGAMKEGSSKHAVQGGQTGITIRSEDISGLVAYSLAVCAELVLYKRENENNNKDYLKSMPDMWEKYFNECLKPLCTEVRCTQDSLKDYSDKINCPKTFLNEFLAKNENEYIDIADKFFEYTEKKYAKESPEHSEFKIKGGCFSLPTGMSFTTGIYKMKQKFAEICKSAPDTESLPLLKDFSPDNSSESTTPST